MGEICIYTVWLITQALKICNVLWRNRDVKSKWLYPEAELIKHNTFHQYHHLSPCFFSFYVYILGYHSWDIFVHRTLSKVAPPPHPCPKLVLASKAMWAHIPRASLPTLQLDKMQYCHILLLFSMKGKKLKHPCAWFFVFYIAHITVPEVKNWMKKEWKK